MSAISIAANKLSNGPSAVVVALPCFMSMLLIISSPNFAGSSGPAVCLVKFSG